jgi:hypothetical protein
VMRGDWRVPSNESGLGSKKGLASRQAQTERAPGERSQVRFVVTLKKSQVCGLNPGSTSIVCLDPHHGGVDPFAPMDDLLGKHAADARISSIKQGSLLN